MIIASSYSLTRVVMEVNFFGAVSLTKTFLELIRESKGRVINVSSLNGIIGTGSKSAYCASKFALEGFSDSLRKEVAPLGVAVSIVNPGTAVYCIIVWAVLILPRVCCDKDRREDDKGYRVAPEVRSEVARHVWPLHR